MAQVDRRFQLVAAERARISREIHDTLLQSFQGATLQFYAVTHMLTDRPEARKRLESIIDQAQEAINEGRDAVQGLRSSTLIGNDLAKAIGVLGEDLLAGHNGQSQPQFGLKIEGETRKLVPLVSGEVYHIAREALRNAFHHARARRIEVEIRYDTRQLRLRVRDDGIGIDPRVLSLEGRPGHFGLKGMRERARGIGGRLEVWSEHGAGTEVELVIPASVAYGRPCSRRLRLFNSTKGTTS